MSKILSWFRPFVVPLIMFAVAALLMVPWSYLVIKAAYQRDILENAKSLAKRVEIQRKMTYAVRDDPRAPGYEVREKFRQIQMVETLRSEIITDPTVKSLVYYHLGYAAPANNAPQPVMVSVLGIINNPSNFNPLDEKNRLNEEQIREIKALGGPKQEQIGDIQKIRVPLVRDGVMVGVTDMELSRTALTQQFWAKEGPLVWKVAAWTVSGMLGLTALGMFAYRAWLRAGRVERRAELEQQGMRAERGLTAAVFAHEIRNPLQALRFQLHSLRKNTEDPARVTSTAETIDSELLRIQQLVTDYLEHEKASTLRIGRVDLLDAAQKLQTVMNELMKQSGTTLTIAGPSSPVEVLCDPHALRQVLMNLVLNAQQAMVQGGSITITIGLDGDFGTVSVADTGPGIPEEIKARLFKPFQTTKKEGTGIGLALVKRFVDNFEGGVHVDSETGRGTTFVLKLPLSDVQERTIRPVLVQANVPAVLSVKDE